MAKVSRKQIEKELKEKFHFAMFHDRDAAVYRLSDKKLRVEVGDDERVVTEKEYVNIFSNTFPSSGIAVTKDTKNRYKAIVCGKFYESENLDDVVWKAIKRLDKKGCLDEAVHRQTMLGMALDKMETLLKDIDDL